MPLAGVFLVPPASQALYQLGSAWLGYDIWTRRQQPPLLADELGEARVREWIGRASIFGWHCTVADCLEYAAGDLDEVRTRLAWVASRVAPFTLSGGRIDDYFHANPRTLVAAFDSPDGALARLHRLVVTAVSGLYQATPFYASLEPLLADPLRRNLVRYGAPWVLDHFAPHWSFATSLPDRAAWATLRAALLRRTDLFMDEITGTLHVDAIHLVQQAGDGWYVVTDSFELGGQAGSEPAPGATAAG